MGAKKVDKKKPTKNTEPVITDIAREYFVENGVNMVKVIRLNGNKVVSEQVMPSPEDRAE